MDVNAKERVVRYVDGQGHGKALAPAQDWRLVDAQQRLAEGGSNLHEWLQGRADGDGEWLGGNVAMQAAPRRSEHRRGVSLAGRECRNGAGVVEVLGQPVRGRLGVAGQVVLEVDVNHACMVDRQ